MSWTADQIREFREELGLNQTQFASLLGVDVRSVTRWEGGTSSPTGSAEAILSGLKEKLRKDPDTLTEVLAIVGGAVAVGGLAYLIVKLLDAVTKPND